MAGLLDERRGRRGPVKLTSEIVELIRSAAPASGAQVAEQVALHSIHHRPSPGTTPDVAVGTAAAAPADRTVAVPGAAGHPRAGGHVRQLQAKRTTPADGCKRGAMDRCSHRLR